MSTEAEIGDIKKVRRRLCCLGFPLYILHTLYFTMYAYSCLGFPLYVLRTLYFTLYTHSCLGFPLYILPHCILHTLYHSCLGFPLSPTPLRLARAPLFASRFRLGGAERY